MQNFNFPWLSMTKMDFPGFPGLDFGMLKFHDFQGFPGPVRTLNKGYFRDLSNPPCQVVNIPCGRKLEYPGKNQEFRYRQLTDSFQLSVKSH
jgi:hypothetical protein